MAYLRLFGGLSVEDDQQKPVTGRAAQRRRLAILALLAASPGRCMTREKLVGYLWPESDAEQARHLLSVALYELRKALGEEAVVSRGDEVFLDVDSIGSDLDDFKAALDGSALERAVAVYAGPLLDGVYLRDAPEFEHWIDEQRDAYARKYREALEGLAEARESSGDLRGAIDLWRRLAAVDRYNSRIALRLMTALQAVGDRAAAIQHASIHAQLLQDEFDAEPDPKVVALAERLRSEPVADEADAGEAAAEAPGAPAKTAESSDLPIDLASYHTSPTGTAFEAPGRSASGSMVVRRRWPRPSMILAAVALLSVIAIATWMWRAARPQVPLGIAVLPFTPLSPAPGSELFGEGLAEEIMNALASVRDLHVPARTSAFALQGRDVREVGRILNVTHVLEGSVRWSGNRLRVNARLVNAETQYSLWERDWEREAGDILEMQEEIAWAVVNALLPELPVQDRPLLVRPSTESSEAFAYYVSGRAEWYKRTAEGFRAALEYFGQAQQEDPQYVLPYVGIADVYNLLGAYDYGIMPPQAAYPQAEVAARRALALDPNLAEAHAALANTLFYYGWDWEEAEREYRRAIDLNPGYTPAHHWYSLFLDAMGRNSEALSEITLAFERDPRSSVMSTAYARHFYFERDYDRAIEEYLRTLEEYPTFVMARLGLGLAYLMAGRPEEAITEYRQAVELGAPEPLTLALLGLAYGRLGRSDEARAKLANLRAISRDDFVPLPYFALIHVGLGEQEEAMELLEAAHESKSGAMAYLRAEPVADPLRQHARFQALLERLGLESTAP